MACLEAGLPYSVRGNSDFLARKEIRDLIAYLRLVHNPQDVAALGRIVNTPPRRLAALERRIRGGEELTLARLEEGVPLRPQERAQPASLCGSSWTMMAEPPRHGGGRAARTSSSRSSWR